MAAWRRIHTIMKVTMPTATRATTVSSCSCWRWGSDWSSTCRPTASAMHSAMAAETPTHIARSAVAIALLAQEGADDPDDQRRLDSLSQPDHERWQQRSPLFDPTEGTLT